MKVSEMWPQIEVEYWCSKCGRLNTPHGRPPVCMEDYVHLVCGGQITIRERLTREAVYQEKQKVDWSALWWSFIASGLALTIVVEACDWINSARGVAATNPLWCKLAASLVFLVSWTDTLYHWSRRR